MKKVQEWGKYTNQHTQALFSNDKNIDSVRELIKEVREYIRLRYEHLRFYFMEKLIVLLSALVVGVLLMVVFAVALLFLAYAFVLTLASAVGGPHISCAIAGCLCLLTGWVIYHFRKPLILRPLTRFIVQLFLEEEDKEDKKEEEP